MNKLVQTETVYADIRVYFQRTTFESPEGSYTEITPTAVNPLDTKLTGSEQDYIPEMIMESTYRSDYLNALLNALAGKGTNL
jgi:hypothetical protein